MYTIREKTIKQLLWVGIGSICMFFGGLTSAYIVRKAEGNWTVFVLPEWFWYSTIIIVISSVLLLFAKKNIKKNISVSKIIISVFLLGVIFTVFQVNGWQTLINRGVYLTGEGSNVSGSFLYVLTLAHLVHLIGGLVALLFTSISSLKGKYNANNYLGLELTMTYWHFLGLLWIYLFCFLKYL